MIIKDCPSLGLLLLPSQSVCRVFLFFLSLLKFLAQTRVFLHMPSQSGRIVPLIVFNVVEQKSHFALILETFVKYSHNNDLGAILINN